MLSTLKKTSIQKKQILSFLAVGVPSIIILSFIALSATSDSNERMNLRLADTAQTLGEMIDRGMKERYNDAQVFAANPLANDKEVWYDPSSALIRSMNDLVRLYDVYYLTVLVDKDGRVAAVNSEDSDGKPLDTRAVYKMSFKSEPWFQNAIAGRFTTRQPFAAPGNDRSTGTWIDDVAVDPVVKAVFPGDVGLAVGFSAPVHDDAGNVVGVWKNYVRFSMVEEIVQSYYKRLADDGLDGAEFTLLDGVGRVIVDYDPKLTGSANVPHDMSVILALNLVERGAESAKRAVSGEKGAIVYTHTRKNVDLLAGYAHFSGADGFPGMNWAALVKVPTAQGYAVSILLVLETLIAAGACLLLVIVFGFLMGKKMARPMVKMAEAAQRMAAGDLDHKIDYDKADELGTLARSLEAISATLHRFNGELEGLVGYARLGDLGKRCSIDGFQGSYRDLMEGVNSVLEAFVAPMRDLRESLGAAANGDLTSKMNGEYAGEYAALKHAWNSTLDALNAALGEALESAEQVDRRSEQIGRSAKSLADGAAEQAATLEEISAQMAQMSMQTKANADSATTANMLAERARDGATRGDHAMNEMVEAMNAIEGSSKDISRIIKVIDEI
ncbi:MAG: methyl-accepting chemotaxis protein, partial [Myxococcales bacterium]|nr:methyl-accepting chemotaxis protein [Myxococcales bacterium]